MGSTQELLETFKEDLAFQTKIKYIQLLEFVSFAWKSSVIN